MIVDYENPLKKMMEEFVPHGKVNSVTYMSTCYVLVLSTDSDNTSFGYTVL